jgi:hypothetical protein
MYLIILLIVITQGWAEQQQQLMIINNPGTGPTGQKLMNKKEIYFFIQNPDNEIRDLFLIHKFNRVFKIKMTMRQYQMST